ncbi:MAG: hypothetical protein KTR28_05470 [Micavibrio sp.]|nr:hypothetical protein [Micavibrio sp.]
MKKKTKSDRHSEQGNALLIILIGVALFAALSFTVSRSMNSSTTEKLSAQQASLAASEIITYAQRMERAVNSIRNKGASESDISFQNSGLNTYENTNCTANMCRIFHPQGAGMQWISPPENSTNSGDWIITGATCIPDLGTGSTNCGSDTDTSNEELILTLTNINQTVCESINAGMGIDGIPADSTSGASTTVFTGSFADGTEITLANGPFQSACFSRGGSNYFYRVLLER